MIGPVLVKKYHGVMNHLIGLSLMHQIRPIGIQPKVGVVRTDSSKIGKSSPIIEHVLKCRDLPSSCPQSTTDQRKMCVSPGHIASCSLLPPFDLVGNCFQREWRACAGP